MEGDEKVDDDDDGDDGGGGVYVQLHGLFHAVSPPLVWLIHMYLWTNIHVLMMIMSNAPVK